MPNSELDKPVSEVYLNDLTDGILRPSEAREWLGSGSFCCTMERFGTG